MSSFPSNTTRECPPSLLILQGNVLPATLRQQEARGVPVHGAQLRGGSALSAGAASQARGLVKEGELPLSVACAVLQRDGVTILHTVGGDDTNIQAAELARYLEEQ